MAWEDSKHGEKRKYMGIEPTCTCETVDVPHNGFEDRGRHQADSYFPS